MTPVQRIANHIIDYKENCPLTDRAVVGNLLQPCDQGADYIEGNSYYPWYFVIGQYFMPKRIAEMGTRFGYSLKAIIDGSGHFWNHVHVAVVDDQRDGIDSLSVMQSYFGPRLGTLDVSRMDTQKLSRIPGTAVIGLMDLVHVDAWHTEAGCYHECELAYDAVRSGGVILVDDTNPGDVRTGAERFCRDRRLDFAFLPTLRGMHMILCGD